MKNVNEQLIDKLEVEGVNANGYGIMPKIVMQDKRLTIEAKAIYAYIISYAGAGNTAFPSLKKIVSDLQIGENRFYKHRKLLIECNYITVTQIRNEKKEIIKNLYTLIANPKKEKEEIIEGGTLQNEGYPIPQNEGCPIPQNEGHISNRFKINKLKDDDDILKGEVNYFVQGKVATQDQLPTHKSLEQTLDNQPYLKSFTTDLIFAGVTPSDCLAIINYLATLTMSPLVAELVQAQIQANELEAHTNGLTNYKAYFLTGLKQKLANADIVEFLENQEIDMAETALVPKITMHNWVTS